MIHQRESDREAEDDDSGDKDSATETGKNLHACMTIKNNPSMFQKVRYDLLLLQVSVWKLRDYAHQP